jgi:uncharacterized protein with von Willebrand factor type A (vWA) domain
LPDETKISTIGFGTDQTEYFSFGDYTTQLENSNAVRNVAKQGSEQITNVTGALKFAVDNSFINFPATRAKSIVLITDGKFNRKYYDPIREYLSLDNVCKF